MKKSTSESFVLELKLQTSKEDDKYLAHCFSLGSRMYNTLIRHCRKQLSKLKRDPQYQRVLFEYANLLKSGQKGTPEARSAAGKLNSITREYGLTEYQLHGFVKQIQHEYENYIGSNTAQKIASRVWKAVESVLYGSGRNIYFKRTADFVSMEGKNNKANIRFKNGRLYYGSREIGISFDRSDSYECEALKHHVKYCRIVRRLIGSSWHYYLQLVLSGQSPKKSINTKHGEKIGLDIGPSTIAIVSNSKCMLRVINPFAGKYQKRIAMLQQKMGQSRRTLNPQNYNSDGTVKTNPKRWIYSKNYKTVRARLSALCSRRRRMLSQEQNILVKDILSMGDVIFAEPMDFAGLKERSKNPDGAGSSGFGYGIQNHSPGLLISKLKAKTDSIGGTYNEVSKWQFRASQYNHADDTYIKKELSDRTFFVGGLKVQRDLYSAFVLMNADETLIHTDRQKCIDGFNTFIKNQNECINKIKKSGERIPKSFGIPA